MRPPPVRSAYLYGATCSMLRELSRDVGFDVLHVGISEDPLGRIAQLRHHASLSYFEAPFDEDDGPCDWSLTPIGRGLAMPPGLDPWAGAIRFVLPPDVPSDEVARRLGAFLAPLDFVACAQTPSLLRMRWMVDRFLPVSARYTPAPEGPKLVRDLYCVDEIGDDAFVLAALAAALTTLGPNRAVFEPVIATLTRPPRSGEWLAMGDRGAWEPS